MLSSAECAVGEVQPACLIDGTQEVGSQAHRPQDVGDVSLRRCSPQLTVDVGDLTRCIVVLDPPDPSHQRATAPAPQREQTTIANLPKDWAERTITHID